MLTERFLLAEERLQTMTAEEKLKSPFQDFFMSMAYFLISMCETCEQIHEKGIQSFDLVELKQKNRAMYEDVVGENYQKSYANPDYCAELMGEDYGKLFCFLAAEMRGLIPFVYEMRQEELVIRLEVFLEIYGSFVTAAEEDCIPDYEAIKEILYWFVSDYTEMSFIQKLKNMLEPSSDYAVKIIMESDLSRPDYLYYYGEYITDNEEQTWKHLISQPEDVLQKMADTYTEGYRIGFLTGNKDITKKKTVNIRYCIGFEPMIRKAIINFRKMGLEPTVYRAASSVLQGKGLSRVGFYGAIPNKQYDFDHKDDQALVLDRKLVQIRMEAWKKAYEKYRTQAAVFGGPAVVEVFGESPFELKEKKTALHLSKQQQELSVEYMSAAGELQNRYIKGEERSFTIIAFPTPEIGENFADIFNEVIRINTLDYQLYQRMQQKIIDALDRGDYVLVKGMRGNKTSMKVKLHKLTDRNSQTNFENCVADVNIPVGEVFTSPVLAGTEGTLHVSSVYLNELKYVDIMLTIKDGMVTDYSCRNFEEAAENRKYMKDNVLFHHESLPVGEFAIGTNTTAFVMARKYQIEDKLPILIAEKTGPHFALGDTCYSHAEDVTVFNPDGKEIIARDNECSLRRKEGDANAYFNCHTDITIPYDELGEVSVVTEKEEIIPIIEEGRFVLEGCEDLNLPFSEE